MDDETLRQWDFEAREQIRLNAGYTDDYRENRILELITAFREMGQERDEFEREYQKVFALLVKAEEDLRKLKGELCAASEDAELVKERL